MQRILLKNGLVVALVQLVLAILISLVLGFSWVVVLTSLLAVAVVVTAIYWQMKPLAQLDSDSAKLLKKGNVSIPDDSFQRIRAAAELRERELEGKLAHSAENQERFDAVLSGMAQGVIAIDSAGNLLFCNRVARSILSMVSPNIVGMPMVGQVRYEVVHNAVKEALDSGKIVTATFQTHEADRREIDFRVAPMSGQPMPGLTLVFNDVTEIRRLENIRRDFVANVSHELKTPLSSIKAYAETLRMGAIERAPENIQFVEQIEQQADLLTQQIQDLLQLARVESGRQTFNLESVDLGELSQSCIEKFAKGASKKQIEILFETSIEDPQRRFVWADQEGIQTICDNLLSNAIRYSHAGSKIVLFMRQTGSDLALEIRDSGIGIDHKYHERIFERFFRVDKARSRELGGTGLGLAIVKHLVQSFDGKIEVQSKLGVGTTFTVTFPAAMETNAGTRTTPQTLRAG